jgi:hypothetical protein
MLQRKSEGDSANVSDVGVTQIEVRESLVILFNKANGCFERQLSRGHVPN